MAATGGSLFNTKNTAPTSLFNTPNQMPAISSFNTFGPSPTPSTNPGGSLSQPQNPGTQGEIKI